MVPLTVWRVEHHSTNRGPGHTEISDSTGEMARAGMVATPLSLAWHRSSISVAGEHH